MQRRPWKIRITDILQSIEKILRYTDGVTLEAFERDGMMIDAVVRNLEIIGEAVRNVPAEVQDRYPEIPWGRMRGIRNVIVHQYDEIDVVIIWKTAQQDLSPLVPLLHTILDQEP